jgi:TM2 domain-containing membrane protein YozV
VATYGKSKATAGILGILLGDFGAHKFYLGETGMGILYLVFFWTFIPGLIGLIEGIMYLTMTDDDFQRRFGGQATNVGPAAAPPLQGPPPYAPPPDPGQRRV